MMKRTFYCVFLTVVAAMPLYPQTVTPIRLTAHRGFDRPVGIDHHQPTNKVVLSVNYPTGQPHNFELVDVSGNRQPFSNIRGLTEEVKIATARDDGGGKSLGGFTPGELFTGTGVPGHIARISADGAAIQNPWLVLPGEAGLLRGSLHVDRTGVFGGDLIVVTTEPTGNVWRVTSAGVTTKLASLGTHLEGVTTVPNDTAKYGPWAGKILTGAEQQHRIYAIDPSGHAAFFSLGVDPEDFDIIPANENFFGVDFGGGILWTAPPAEFADKVGDLLITQEFPAHLYHVRWTGAQFQVTRVAQATQWEHVTFSTSPLDTCEVAIISPVDSTVICSDAVTVTAKFQISTGKPPLKVQSDINGVPATVSGNTFTAITPLAPGWNTVIAACAVTDSGGRTIVCSDTIRVESIIDDMAPTCVFKRESRTAVAGTFFDLESGIAKFEPLLLLNVKLTVEPFKPGDKQVNFRVDAIDANALMGFDIKIIDRCGNSHVCDPVLFQLEADRQNQPYDVTFRSIDRYLRLANRGLEKIRIDLNGNSFSLLSRLDGMVKDLNSYYLPLHGELAIDLQKYLRDGDNHIRFEFEGPSGASAAVMLINEAPHLDHALELLPVPAEYQLSQNYPNPFGGATAPRLAGNATTIRFSVPARVVEGTRVQLRIYSALGELVRVLLDEKIFPGNYAVSWDGQNRNGVTVASGVYIYQLVTGNAKQTKRMVVLR